jgi:hypothetical protein
MSSGYEIKACGNSAVSSKVTKKSVSYTLEAGPAPVLYRQKNL